MHLLDPHDVGGAPDATPLCRDARSLSLWEKQTDALFGLLASKQLVNVDALRRAIESLEPEATEKLPYYGKWASAMAKLCVERGVLTEAHLNDALGGPESSATPSFAVGEGVVVRPERTRTRWRKPHLRVPGYLFGAKGVVERVCGVFPNPEVGLCQVNAADPQLESAWFQPLNLKCDILVSKFAFKFNLYRYPEERAFFGNAQSTQPLYRVRFRAADIWRTPALARGDAKKTNEGDGDGDGEGEEGDSVDVEVYEHWLEKAKERGEEATEEEEEKEEEEEEEEYKPEGTKRRRTEQGHTHKHHDHHDEHHHHHEHEHEHLPRDEVERTAVEREGPDAFAQHFAEALRDALVAAGVVTAGELRAAVERLDAMGSKGEGARIVAKAWVDPAFKARLLADATAAAAEIGISAANNTAPTVLTVVENTPAVHNLVVCTLCSCYPRSILGMSPDWYKSRSYRARAVREPRLVLAEFGTELPPGTAVRVHDSTADLRYLVLPIRPAAGTEGWGEERLAELVTRDSMIGVCTVALETPSR
jgi:nitrile hydratase